MKSILLLLAISIGIVAGLFEDQTGTYDWRQQYIGRPLYTHIDSAEQRVYLATEQNVLAALNKKNGNIIWRKIFENNENGGINHVLWSKNDCLLVSGNGRYVKSFNYKHGYVKFEFNLFKNNANGLKYNVIESNVEIGAYYVTNGFELCYLNAEERFCTDLPTENVYDGDLVETDRGVVVIGRTANGFVRLQFNGALTTVLSQTTFEAKWFQANSTCFTNDNQFTCVDLKSGELYSSDLKSATLNFQHYTFTTKPASDSRFVNKIQNNILFENQESNQLSLYRLHTNTLTIEPVKTFENYLSFYVASNHDENLVVVARPLGNKLNFYAYSFENGNERTDLFVSASGYDNKRIIYSNGVLFDIRSGQSVLNHLCLYDDYTLVLYAHTGNKFFTREEALSRIVTVEMVDFPLTHLQEEFEEEFGTNSKSVVVMLLKRIKSQVYQFKEALEELSKKILNLNSNKRQAAVVQDKNEGTETLLKRDEFNLNKLIVCVTEIGKVFGIHTSTGQIVWSFAIDSTQYRPYLNGNKVTYPLYVQRTAAHYPHEAQAVIVAKGGVNDAQTRLFVFNPLNGLFTRDYDAEKDLTFNYNVKNTFAVGSIDSHFIKPIVLFDSENRAHIFPKSCEDLILKSAKPYIIYIATSNALSGYSLKAFETPLPKLWNINLNDETIVSIGAKLPHDRTHSQGKVLGDRSVLYKYLNPNLIGLVTEGLDNQNFPFVNVYLVDTVNGNILTSFNHKRSKGPVHIVHSENWFFYSYNNLKYRRYEVTSIELFEGQVQYNSTHFSSFDPIKPIIYTKSYIVQKSFDAMQLTITEKGIATKDVIVACPSGTIVEIPWILIDARRPQELTELEREEGLIPYMPEIPLNYEFSLNYYNYVYNIRGILTSPSGLESTSLVFVYGLDVFFTRVFPSRTFDMLREDFDYFFIITLMIGLVLGTVLTKKFAAIANLKKAWK